MAGHVSHPFGGGQSASEQRVERLTNLCWKLGLLGVLGFLEYLRPLAPVFDVAQLFYLFFLLFFVPPLVGAGQYLSAYVRGGDSDSSVNGGDSDDPASWVETGYEPHPLKVLQTLAMMVHPNTFFRSWLQLLGTVVVFVRYRGDLPDPQSHDSEVDYRLPFDGEWTVLNGSPDPSHSHSWFPPQQRYAYDFAKTDDEGRTHDGSGGPESFYCFDEPIVAPADGTVVSVKDGHRDYHRTSGWVDPLQYRLVGNAVVIEHDGGEYSLLAHLKRGSVCVSEGDTVERGEEVGRCGHSGNSTEPHLHFQVQDRANFYLAASLPVAFDGVTTESPGREATTRDRAYVHCGQVVSAAELATEANARPD